MNTFAMLLGLASVALPAPAYTIEVTVCQGDPRGSKAAGTIDVISQPTLGVTAGQIGYVHVGQDWTTTGPDGATTTHPLGVTLRALPTPAAGGKVRLRLHFQHATVAVRPGAADEFRVEAVETTAEVKPGEPTRVRAWAKGGAEQTWLDVTVRPAK